MNCNKITLTLVLSFLMSFSTLFAQSFGVYYVGWSGVTCPTTGPTFTPITTVPNVSFGQFSRGSGVTCASASNGFSGSGFNVNTLALAVSGNKYFEWTVSADITTLTLNIDSLALRYERSSTGPQKMALYTSVNGGSYVFKDSVAITSTANANSAFVFSPSLTAPARPANALVTFRLYLYQASASGGTFRVKINEPGQTGTRLTGSTTTAGTCTPPSTSVSSLLPSSVSAYATSFNFVKGSGDSTIVVMRSGSPVSVNPSEGVNYIPNSTFGLGSTTTTSQFVVYKDSGSSFTVTGLTPSTTYYLAAYTYSNTGTACYKITSVAVDTITTQPNPFTITPTSLSGMNYVFGGGPSNAATFTLSASSLFPSTGTLVLNAPSSFEIASSLAGPYSNSITISYSSSSISSTNFFARLKSGLTSNLYVENITLQLNGILISNNISLNGRVTPAPCSELMFSEYIEGTSNEKYVEIYNPTSSAINLNNYQLRLFSNGSPMGSPTFTDNLSGLIYPDSVRVYRNSAASSYTGPTTVASSISYNGDDALGLYKISTSSFVDIFGTIGDDPGASWISGAFNTENQTLVRKSSVVRGIDVNPAPGFPTLTTEWDRYAVNTISNLGTHFSECGVPTPSNDIRCNAINLNVYNQFANWTVNEFNNSSNPNIDTTFGSLYNSTVSAGESYGSCATGSTSSFRSVWYSFRSPGCAATSLRLSTNTETTNFDSRLTVYYAGSTSCVSPLTEVGCNNDAFLTPRSNAAEVTLTPGTVSGAGVYVPNDLYVAQVTGFSGDAGNFGLIVDVNTPDISLSSPTTTGFTVNLPSPATLSGTGYQGALVRYQRDGASGYVQTSLDAVTNTLNVTSALPGTLYNVWVVYRCASGLWFSKKDTIRTLPGCTLGAINPPTLDTFGGCNKVRASWNSVTGASSYRLFWSRVGSGGYSFVNVNDTSYVATLLLGTNYNFWVEASCSSPLPVQRTTSSMVPFSTCAPSRIMAPETQSFSYDGKDFVNMTLSEMALNITPNHNSGVLTVTLKKFESESYNTSSINVEASSMNIFPNPSNESVNIDFTLSSNVGGTIEMFDVNGKSVFQHTINQNTHTGIITVNTANLNAGVYFVKLSSQNTTDTRRLVVTH